MVEENIKINLEVTESGTDKVTKKTEDLAKSLDYLRVQRESYLKRIAELAGGGKEAERQIKGIKTAYVNSLKKTIGAVSPDVGTYGTPGSSRDPVKVFTGMRPEDREETTQTTLKDFEKLSVGHKKMTMKMVKDTFWNDFVQKKFLKAYRWNLSLVLITMNALRRLGADSRVLGAILMMIGKGMGFILDMVLLPLIPTIVKIMEKMIAFGKMWDSLPESLKKFLAGGLALGVTLLIAATVYAGLRDLLGLLLEIKNTWLAVKVIQIVATVVDKVTAGLNVIAAAMGFSSFSALAGAAAAGAAIGMAIVISLEYFGFFDALDRWGRQTEEKFASIMDTLKVVLWPLGILGKAEIGLARGITKGDWSAFDNLLTPFEQSQEALGRAAKKYQQGGTVPWTGLHYLHKGETVVPTGQGATKAGMGTTVNINNPQFIVQRESDRALYESFKLMLDRELRRLNV